MYDLKELTKKRLKLDDESVTNAKATETVNEAAKIEEKRGSADSDENSAKEKHDVIENNRYKAKMILVSKQTHGLITNFGLSWFKILEPEFTRPYFIKVFAHNHFHLSVTVLLS